MHVVSDLYNSIFADPTHEKEIKVKIAGVDYLQDRIVSLSTFGGIFDKPDIGNCSSRQMDLVLINTGEIPRSAKIELFV